MEITLKINKNSKKASSLLQFLKTLDFVTLVSKSDDLSEVNIEKAPNKKGKLSKHYGKLKRNIDGLNYQISIRENHLTQLLFQQ